MLPCTPADQQHFSEEIDRDRELDRLAASTKRAWAQTGKPPKWVTGYDPMPVEIFPLTFETSDSCQELETYSLQMPSPRTLFVLEGKFGKFLPHTSNPYLNCRQYIKMLQWYSEC
jgi:hypothetical protein